MDMTFLGGDAHDPLGHEGHAEGLSGLDADGAVTTPSTEHFAADTGSVFDDHDLDLDRGDLGDSGFDDQDAGVTHVASVMPAPSDSQGTAGHLFLHQDGRIWDLGPADVDTDADGVRDSLTRSGPDGLTVYTDTDRDGQVDKITEVGADGKYSSTMLDQASGAWVSGDSGRIG